MGKISDTPALSARVLRYIVRTGLTSRKEIAAALRVTQAAISGATAELLAQNRIVEIGSIENNRVGRNCVMLDVNENFAYVLGLDLSSSNILITLLNVKAKVVASQTIAFDQLQEHHLRASMQWVTEQCHRVGKEKILGVAMLAPGNVQEEQQHHAPLAYLREELVNILGLAPILMNNIRGLAISETYFGSSSNNFVILKYGPGVGGVIVQNGEIVQGYNNSAGEIGHITWPQVSPQPCDCCKKNGCLESMIHYKRIVKEADPTGGYPDDSTDAVLQASQRDGYQTLYRALDQLVQAASILMDVVDPEIVFVAGELFTKPLILDYWRDALNRILPAEQRNKIAFVEEYKEKRFRAAGAVVLSQYFDLAGCIAGMRYTHD